MMCQFSQQRGLRLDRERLPTLLEDVKERLTVDGNASRAVAVGHCEISRHLQKPALRIPLLKLPLHPRL